jgi:ABC-type transporter Mla MlaB component
MFELTGGEERAVLIVSGEVNIQNALAFRDVLKEWMGRSDTLDLNLEGVTDADLTCLQLICSAHRSVLDMRKSLNVSGKLPGAIVKTVREAGFVRERGCRGEESHKCMWIVGAEK